MNIPLSNSKINRNIAIVFSFLLLQLLLSSNSYAIKLTLNGLPTATEGTVLELNEDVVYNHGDMFRPIVTNTIEPFLCLGPNLAGTPSANVSFGMSSSDPFKVFGLVEVSSLTYDFSPLLLQDKNIDIVTAQNSQCVVKGFQKVTNPSPGNPLIFIDSFEDSMINPPVVNPDLSITLLENLVDNELPNNIVISNNHNFVYRYEVRNIGDTPITFDIVDYFSQSTNSTSAGCTPSMGAVVATQCGTDDTTNGKVYIKNAHIENNDEFLIITVTRNPIIPFDNTPIDLLVTALVTSANDIYKLNNSDTRDIIGNTNASPVISTVADTNIFEDSLGTGAIGFTVSDAETPAANLNVTATSSDQNIVADANIIIANGATDNDRTVTVVANTNANTSGGPVTITLQVADSNGGTEFTNFNVNVTPVNDKPIFSLVPIADYPAGTSGNQIISNFIQNIIYGPTTDESTQSIISRSISIDSDPNGVLSATPLLSTDLFLSLTGQGGTATLNVTIQDDGGTLNGGLDTSDVVSFTVTVLNTLPTISMVNNTNTNEDTSIMVGFTISDPETPAAMLTMSAMSSDVSIVPISGIQFSGTTGSRTVEIFPSLHQNTDGISPVTITLIVNDGSDTSQSSFDLTINPVNDMPTFSLDSNIINLVADAGSLIQVLNFATALSMGPTSDEDLTQNVLNYNVSVTDTNNIFDQSTVLVDINNNGTLNYVLSGATGVATIDVSLQDDGSTANGGVDTSIIQSFTITVQ